ncbi:MAG: glycosyltransferase family 4 protein [Candidatus Portnoybacteria bacterium]|nr:glycosyltransferase family 4 protein [Candidatus Portnoybacteria bacterium]
MRILSNDFFSNAFPAKQVSSGGPARFAKSLSQAAINEGGSWIGIIIRNEKESQIKIENLKKEGRASYWKLTLPTKLYKKITLGKKNNSPEIILKPVIDKLKLFIEKSRPDVIFLNGFSIYAWIVLKAAFETKTPLVIKHAGILKKEIDIYHDFFSKAGAKILYETEREISDIARYEIFLNKWSWNVYNKEVRKVSKKQGVIIPLPLPNGYILKRHKPKRVEKIIHIGMVARWDRIKNHPAALALAKRINELKLPWKIHSITLIPETKHNPQLKEEYKKYISVEKQRSAEALKKFYRKMDLIIIPSHFDVSPGIVLEAVSEGVGVLISPNVGWVSEFKRAGAGEWIIDFSNPDKVVRRIKKLIGKEIPYSLLKSIEENHNSKRVFGKYLEIFKKATKI